MSSRAAAALLAVVPLVAGCSGPAGPDAGTTPSVTTSRSPHSDRASIGDDRPWDPRQVDELPGAPGGLAPGLPATLDIPASSASIATDPFSAAILAIQSGDTVQLLSTDDGWRSVPLEGRYPMFALSPDGTRLLTVDGHPDVAPGTPITVWDLATGDAHRVGYPEGFRDWEYRWWRWLDPDTLLLSDVDHGWAVDAATGEATRTPYGSGAIDTDGSVVDSPCCGAGVFIDWARGAARQVAYPTGEGLDLVQVNGETVAGTWDRQVVVADRETLAQRQVLPFRDPAAHYSNGMLSVLAIRDDGTILLRETVYGDAEGIRIVAWQPGSDELSLVSSLPIKQFDFARRLIQAPNP